MTNRQEYMAGTNPHDPSSELSLNAEAIGENDVALSFVAIAGKRYRIEYSEKLGSNTWTLLSAIAPQPVTTGIEISDTPPNLRFYRLVIAE